MKNIPDQSVDLILTDPPYGVSDCRWDSIVPLEPMWECFKRIIKKKGAIVMTASQPFTTTLISSNTKWFKYCWVWEKHFATGFPFSKYQPLRQVEDVVVFYKQHGIYNPQGLKKIDNPKTQTRNWFGKPHDHIYKKSGLDSPHLIKYTNYPKNIIHIFAIGNRPNKKTGIYRDKRYHPTQKPEALMEYLIKTYTNVGDLVLDPFLGSGTTGVSAKNLNREFIGIEMDEEYFNISKERLDAV